MVNIGEGFLEEETDMSHEGKGREGRSWQVGQSEDEAGKTRCLGRNEGREKLKALAELNNKKPVCRLKELSLFCGNQLGIPWKRLFSQLVSEKELLSLEGRF